VCALWSSWLAKIGHINLTNDEELLGDPKYLRQVPLKSSKTTNSYPLVSIGICGDASLIPLHVMYKNLRRSNVPKNRSSRSKNDSFVLANFLTPSTCASQEKSLYLTRLPDVVLLSAKTQFENAEVNKTTFIIYGCDYEQMSVS